MTSSLRSLPFTSVVLIACTVTYALWPLPSPPAHVVSLSSSSTSFPSQSIFRTLDLTAFRAPLWIAPIPAPAPAAPPPPPPPLKLQLIAITQDPALATLAATIFDPDLNRLVTLSEGQSLGQHIIVRITPSAIDIKDATVTRTLSLRPDAAPSGGTP